MNSLYGYIDGAISDFIKIIMDDVGSSDKKFEFYIVHTIAMVCKSKTDVLAPYMISKLKEALDNGEISEDAMESTLNLINIFSENCEIEYTDFLGNNDDTKN